MTTHKSHCFWLTPLLLVLVTTASLAERRIVLNPYETVAWEKHHRHHGSFHVHTTESDGKMDPAAVIDAHLAIDHRVVALTDHDKHTWPWQRFDRDPEKLGMIAVPGNELSRHHHTLSLFSDLETEENNHDAALKLVEDHGGISVLAHPGRYWELSEGRVSDEARERYAELFRNFPNLIGMEVINQTNRYTRDRALWDALLTELMPGRPVWGMANDDSHEAGHIGLNTTVLMLPEFEQTAVRTALENGRFYFTTITTHSEEERDRARTPVIRGITYDPQAGTLTILADPGSDAAEAPLSNDRYHWISAGGRNIHEGPTLDLNTTEGIEKYVRLEIRGDGGTAYTQPFGIGDASMPE